MDSDGACYTMLCLFRVYQMKLDHNARNIEGLLFYTLTTKSKAASVSLAIHLSINEKCS